MALRDSIVNRLSSATHRRSLDSLADKASEATLAGIHKSISSGPSPIVAPSSRSGSRASLTSPMVSLVEEAGHQHKSSMRRNESFPRLNAPSGHLEELESQTPLGQLVTLKRTGRGHIRSSSLDATGAETARSMIRADQSPEGSSSKNTSTGGNAENRHSPSRSNIQNSPSRRHTQKIGTFGGASRFKDAPVDLRDFPSEIIGAKSRSKKNVCDIDVTSLLLLTMLFSAVQ